jgi:NNP family nitrate/nitrite transporter-like MFS transporter
MFYVDWFELPKITAALLAGIYPFINLFARPGGGYLSDKYGRKLTLMIVFFGVSLSFIASKYAQSRMATCLNLY